MVAILRRMYVCMFIFAFYDHNSDLNDYVLQINQFYDTEYSKKTDIFYI